MSLLESLLLGVLQGLTEFFPVSSSGHLVLAQALLGVRVPGVLFEVVVHLGTLCAVLWVYRARVFHLLHGLFSAEADSRRYVGLLLLATLPAAVAGLWGRSFFEDAFERPVAAASFLLLSGMFAWSLKRSAPRADRARPGAGGAFAVGLAQALAILPGVSRSGATVATGAWLGVEVTRMAEFSFLMSVPAIAGAGLAQLDQLGSVPTQAVTPGLAIGFAAACLSGIAAIRIFLWMLKARTFHRFAYYCWSVGVVYLIAAALVPALR